MQNSTEAETKILFIVFITIFLILCISALFVNVIIPFWNDRKYIKAELNRSYEYDEYLYWKNELKKLYISYIPVIGKMLFK